MELTKEVLDKVRHIEGFPIGRDEDIIAISDPPYYTACPNPFIDEFIEKYGRPYDEENDSYHREPFTADISEGKNDPIYNAHSYHTKVPHKAIMRYILHYTEPGDIVFDGFCGTGMTGVAAQMCGNPDPEFKLKVENEMKARGEEVKWGARRAILCDLSPAATFIAYNYNSPVNAAEFEKEAKRILDEVEKECGWMYETYHTIDGEIQNDVKGMPIKGRINYTVWSDVFVCPSCSEEVVFWDAAVDKESGKVLDEFECPHCGASLSKGKMERAWRTYYDKAIGETVRQAKQVPVWINYTAMGRRYEKKPDAYDLELIDRIEGMDIPYWYPTDRMPEGDESRRNDRIGITHVHHFYTKRNLWVLSALYERVGYQNRYRFLIESYDFVHDTKMTRIIFKKNNTKPILTGNQSGTLYISSLPIEKNIINGIKLKLNIIKNIFLGGNNSIISTQSTSSFKNVKPNSIDYIFTDPPFGDNLMYSELNFLWEAWLKVFTNNKQEAIINRVQGKGLHEYQELMEKCFAEMYRVLKPGRWMTVEFHNSKNSVWNAIQQAILKAGFVIADVRSLDKKQGSFNQVTTTTAMKKDMIISAYKPRASFVEGFLNKAGTEEAVWDYVRQHLEKLPVVVETDKGEIDIVKERTPQLLYDSMIKFHVMHGLAIPMGAADFYAGLEKHFIERDGMYFLPTQVSIYDRRRMMENMSDQFSFLVSDEKTAIQWLLWELSKSSQTYQDIEPKFLKAFHQARHESMPELSEILEENFLKDEEGRWYIPDPNKKSDLERLREKTLLKQFEEYKNSRGRLKEFRSEAIRAGFKKCWGDKDYKTIADIGDRLPSDILEEDDVIMMYYDNALTRLGQ